MKETKLPTTAPVAILARISGLTERRIQQLAEEGKIPKPKTRGEYPFEESLRAIFMELREREAGCPAQTAQDKARQAKADADRSEMQTAKEAGQLVLKSDVRLIWENALVKMRIAVLRLPGVSDKTKALIAKTITGIRLDDKDEAPGEDE